MLEKAELTLIIMLSKTKKVITTSPPVLYVLKDEATDKIAAAETYSTEEVKNIILSSKKLHGIINFSRIS